MFLLKSILFAFYIFIQDVYIKMLIRMKPGAETFDSSTDYEVDLTIINGL